MAQRAALLMTMSDIAALARVKRPVVSVWRARNADTAHPFPAPVTQRRGQALFDAGQVGEWLSDTRRGNNPDARADAAAHATLDDATRQGATQHLAMPRAPAAPPTSTFTALTALLALRRSLGHALSTMSDDELLDAADELDPDDESFYREIEGTHSRVSLAVYVDDLVEAAYTESVAFEHLLANRSIPGSGDRGDSPLSPIALGLMAQTALALAATRSSDATFVDASGTSSDIIVAISNERANERTEQFTGLSADGDSATARLFRRRMIAHDIPRRPLHVQDDGSFVVTGAVVHLGQFPAQTATTAIEILTAIDQMALQMDDEQLAVMIAPASVLCDAGLSRQADELRSMVLRSGRVRAIVRLPVGLFPRKPQQALALWILGAAHEGTDLADRWTLVADLTAHRLDATSISDLVSDLVASLGDRATVRAHAFRFARLALTRKLIASRDSLIAGTSAPPTRSTPLLPTGADLAIQVDALLTALGEVTPAHDLTDLNVEAVASPTTTRTLTIEQRIAARQLTYIPGNRLDDSAIVSGAADVYGAAVASGIRVIGPAEIHGELPLGSRSIDRLRFATDYPAGRITEPGDVIFCTSPNPRAIVDTDGTSVVTFPARILRLGPSVGAGAGIDSKTEGLGVLIAEIVAADINALAPQHKRWKSWVLREVKATERVALVTALGSVRSLREAAVLRMTRLDELTTLLMAGSAAGTLTLTLASETSAPPKGTT
jgi:hypothetical protein